ncbi:Tektin-2-like [Homarus americanus]|uniref:Tektin n=1 Tax=Homarus americanus TaxID=6706 RepID=A0A8J5MS55_HOMAM|nr:Tektin-2-like [Homarus americanus]
MRVEKPVMRYLPADWHRNNDALRQASHDTRTTSHNFRHQSHHLRDQTRNKTCWDCEDNTTRLHDRVYELQRVTDDLQRSLKQVNDEISKLENAKETAEAELEAHVYPLNTALECLTIRERRREGDLVKDDPEEVRLLEKSRANLEKVVLEAVSHLRVLHDAKQRLQDDLKDKRAALQVDGTQTALTVYSPQISFKPDPLRVPKVRREDEAQQTATDYSVRRRLHQETRARDELQWQKDCLLEEIRAQEKEILDLEEQLRASSLPLKVAQTRLEGRTQRVRNDLVRDAPQDGLMAEVQHLTETRRLLRDSLARALDTLHALQRHLRTVDVDLGRKSLSVTLEKKVQGSRQALKDRKPSETLTHTNLTLTGSLRAHPTHIL